MSDNLKLSMDELVLCNLVENSCFENKCENGNCFVQDSNYTCVCKEPFKGEFCDESTDYCKQITVKSLKMHTKTKSLMNIRWKK